MRINRRGALIATLGVLAAPGVHAQAWPDRPVRLVIPYPPGGGTDIGGRIIGGKLGEVLGQPVVIDNRGGAGGMIGTRAVGMAPPDGYTLLFHGTTSIVREGFDPRTVVKDVVRVAITHNILVVNETVPATTVPAFIEYAKARPGQLNHGTAGPLTSQHLSAVMFDLLAGTKIENVHYRGTGPSIAGILGNEVQLMFASISGVLPLVQEGRLKAMATASARKSLAMPQLPTMNEFLPGYASELTYSFCTPINTPDAIQQRLSEAARHVVEDQATIAVMAARGFEPFYESGESLTRAIEEDVRLWADVVQRAGIRLDEQ